MSADNVIIVLNKQLFLDIIVVYNIKLKINFNLKCNNLLFNKKKTKKQQQWNF